MIVTRPLLVLGASVALFCAEVAAASCELKCVDSFKSPVAKSSDAAAACQKGCKLSSERCEKDCSATYENDDKAACEAGCGFQRSSEIPAEQRADGMLADGFTFTIPIGPRSMNFEMPSASGLFSQVSDIFNDDDFFNLGHSHDSIVRASDRNFSSVFDSMHRQMNDMMSWMMRGSRAMPMAHDITPPGGQSLNRLPGLLDILMPGPVMANDSSSPEGDEQVHGGGELVIVRDGPGFHEEKTYHIGPNGDVSKLLQEGMNDMMAKSNPLENFFRDEDVELFDPSLVGKGKTEDDKEWTSSQEAGDEDSSSEEVVSKPFDFQVFVPFVFSNPGFVEDNDIENGGPRLPENGLRSRGVLDGDEHHFRHIVFADRSDICAQDSSKMKWSDWVTCLHLRHGLPRWLTAATICLGIIFALWLCLVIPSNAPKQKLKRSKNNIDTKEVEAMNNPHLPIITDYPADLPPSYDDVTTGSGLKVKLEPVHQPVKDAEEAGPLPEKLPISQA